MKLQDMKTTANSQVYKRARKRHLARSGQLNCPLCPYHRVENATRKPRHLSWKRLRRRSQHH